MAKYLSDFRQSAKKQANTKESVIEETYSSTIKPFVLSPSKHERLYWVGKYVLCVLKLIKFYQREGQGKKGVSHGWM